MVARSRTGWGVTSGKAPWGEGTVAVAPGVPDALALRKEGYRGRLMLAVPPRRFTGLHPAEIERLALGNDLEPVAVWPVTFLGKEGIAAHRMMRAASPEALSSILEGSAGIAVMPDIEGFLDAFKDAPASLRANADLCSYARCGRIPSGPLPPSVGRSDGGRLRRTVMGLLAESYGSSYVASARAESELRQLEDAGLCGYVLLFRSIVEYCRRRRIACIARGSVAGSIVARLLGLSAVCPLRYGLSFERFYNHLRSEPPDIDLDIDSRYRDQVLEWFLKRTQGRSALVSETVRLGRRSALRMAAAAHGIGREETDEMSRMLRHGAGGFWQRPEAASLLKASKLLVGLPSHLAPHPCGLVCCPGPAADVLPLETDNRGRIMTQLDKNGVERLGLMKMDLLGHRGLSAITMASKSLEASPMVLVSEQERVPSSAFELLGSGCTIGVANVESPAMRCLLRRSRVRSIEDVARALALVRPGASAGGGREAYLRRIHGREPVSYPLPVLRDVLRENLGVMIYQEDVSVVAGVLLGTGPAESDLLRRRLKKGRVGKEEIIYLARRRGLDATESEAAWRLLSGYAGYGFCRAHAFSYAAVSCASATLKVMDPALFIASVLAGGGGFYPSQVYVEEARRMDVRVVPPGANTGEWLSRDVGGAVMLGFRHFGGLGRDTFERLAAGRPYRHPGRMVAEGCPRTIVERMAVGGCFGEMGMTPGQALWAARSEWGSLTEPGPVGLPGFGGYTSREIVLAELEVFGLALGSSMLDIVSRPDGTVPLTEIPSRGAVRVWGRPVARRRLENGASFLMLEDDTGIIDAFLSSDQTRRMEDISGRSQVTLVMEGELESGGRLRALFLGEGPPIPFESGRGSSMLKTRACEPGQHGGCR
jgi:error-prone DNA polymerase